MKDSIPKQHCNSIQQSEYGTNFILQQPVATLSCYSHHSAAYCTATTTAAAARYRPCAMSTPSVTDCHSHCHCRHVVIHSSHHTTFSHSTTHLTPISHSLFISTTTHSSQYPSSTVKAFGLSWIRVPAGCWCALPRITHFCTKHNEQHHLRHIRCLLSLLVHL